METTDADSIAVNAVFAERQRHYWHCSGMICVFLLSYACILVEWLKSRRGLVKQVPLQFQCSPL
jgi:hypothetical protein